MEIDTDLLYWIPCKQKLIKHYARTLNYFLGDSEKVKK